LLQSDAVPSRPRQREVMAHLSIQGRELAADSLPFFHVLAATSTPCQESD
jgi:hypothetical protein